MTDTTPARRVGVRDVAAAAGVSTQTVSRVLNAHPHIRPETRARVLAAMQQLGYRVNNAARTLGTATTRTIGVLASDSQLFGPAAGIVALEQAARRSGRWIATAYVDAADEREVVAGAEHLLAQGVDGIVTVAALRGTMRVLRAAAPAVPVAVLHEPAAGVDRQGQGAALAVAHLAELGHRRVARVAGPDSWLEAVQRDAGAREAMTAHAMVDAGCWRGDWSAASGRALAAAVADAALADGGPTAVAVANDQMALGLVAGLAEAGVRVPHDVSVTGFDDNPDAAHYLPALTTVRLDVAGEAARCIAALTGDPEPPVQPAVLVPRASTAAPRAARGAAPRTGRRADG